MTTETNMMKAARAVALRRAVTDPVRARHREALLGIMFSELQRMKRMPVSGGEVAVMKGQDGLDLDLVIGTDGCWPNYSTWRRIAFIKLEPFYPDITVVETDGTGKLEAFTFSCIGEAVGKCVEIVSSYATA